MGYINVYRKHLVGGSVKLSKLRLRPGHVASFDYGRSQNGRTMQRIVFILNAADTRGATRLVHAINLDKLSWYDFMGFIKRIVIYDTITLIKRKYEVRGPLDEIIDKPLIFYKRILKSVVDKNDIYRTYNYSDISNVRLWSIDYGSLFKKTDENRVFLINDSDNLNKIFLERKALHDIFDITTGRLKDNKYKQLIVERFGNEGIFKKSVLEIGEMIEKNEDLL